MRAVAVAARQRELAAACGHRKGQPPGIGVEHRNDGEHRIACAHEQHIGLQLAQRLEVAATRGGGGGQSGGEGKRGVALWENGGVSDRVNNTKKKTSKNTD